MDIPNALAVAGLVAAAYLLGTVPSAHLVAGRRGVDPLTAGSGNPGATNVYRTAGRQAGLIVFAADIGKGALATGIGLAIGGRSLGLACWAAATLGHVFPATRQFRGGKGVATGGGGSIVLFPILGPAVSLLFALVARVTGKASIGSIVIAIALPAGVGATGRGWCEFLVSAGIAGLVLVRHEGNIRRLVAGEERDYER